MSPDAAPRPSFFWPLLSLLLTCVLCLFMGLFAAHIQADERENREWDAAYQSNASMARGVKQVYDAYSEAYAANHTLIAYIKAETKRSSPFHPDPLPLHDHPYQAPLIER